MSKEEEKSEDLFQLVFHAISKQNGKVNQMKTKEMRNILKENGLRTEGFKNIIKKRLKTHYKKQELAKSLPEMLPENLLLPYYIVIDFEATCTESESDDYLNEIIEFPAVLYNSKTKQVVSRFHSYCKPLINPLLSEYCTKLTGITQKQVDEAPVFSTVIKKFDDWLESNDINLNEINENVAFVTDGSFDFSYFLNIQCELSEIPYPNWARQWINLKKIYCNGYKLSKNSLSAMLESLELPFEGRLHSGKDDANNIMNIFKIIVDDGLGVSVNETLVNGRRQNIERASKSSLPD